MHRLSRYCPSSTHICLITVRIPLGHHPTQRLCTLLFQKSRGPSMDGLDGSPNTYTSLQPNTGYCLPPLPTDY